MSYRAFYLFSEDHTFNENAGAMAMGDLLFPMFFNNYAHKKQKMLFKMPHMANFLFLNRGFNNRIPTGVLTFVRDGKY